MASKIKVREIIHLLNTGQSNNAVVKILNTSCHSVSCVASRMKELNLSKGKIDSLSDIELYKMFFPDKQLAQEIYENPDMEYIQKELTRPHVTLKLLWQEYKAKCLNADKLYMSYPTFARHYQKYVGVKGFANHIYHKPGERVEVDWAGSTMHFINSEGKKVKVYIFVGDLVCSRLAYVRPCLKMDEENWITSHVEMFKYYGGVPSTIICDNLKTGVVSHPKLGEIVLTHEYESFMYHYNTAILPAGVKEPRHKNSTEGSVGNIETNIIAALRDEVFYSFEALKKAVADKLEQHNNAEFTKRSGSRWEYYINNEKAFMKSLPISEYEVGKWIYARAVQSNSHISFNKNFYSVPYNYIGERVDIRVTAYMVHIFKDNKLIKSHKRILTDVQNSYITDPVDMPPGATSTTINADTYRRWAESCGTSTKTVIERILSSKAIVEQTFISAKAVLCLTKKYSKNELEAACKIALESSHCPRYSYIIALLKARQEKNNLENKIEDKTQGILRGASYYNSINNKEN